MKRALFFIICFSITSLLYAVNPSDTHQNISIENWTEYEKEVSQLIDESKIDCALTPTDIPLLSEISKIMAKFEGESFLDMLDSEQYKAAKNEIKPGETFGSIFLTETKQKGIIERAHKHVDWDQYKSLKNQLSPKGEALITSFGNIRYNHTEMLKTQPTDTQEKLRSCVERLGSIATIAFKIFDEKAKKYTNPAI